MTDIQSDSAVHTVDKPAGKPNQAERFLAKLDADITAFLGKHGMTESRFGREVSNNTELLPRLRRRQTSALTLIKIYNYLRDHRK